LKREATEAVSAPITIEMNGHLKADSGNHRSRF